MTAAPSAREVEAKFRVHASFELPELTGPHSVVAHVHGPELQELCAVYWDTADLRLAREGITLRYRSGEGAGDGWHLKLPVQEGAVPDASIGARDEIHDIGPDGAVPETLRDLVTVYVRDAVLGPVATLATARSVLRLAAWDDQPLADLTDDVVSVLSQGHVAARFREIELEDRGGGLPALRDTGQLLRAAGAVAGEFVPKVVRALGPQATADPDPPPPGDVQLSDPLRCAVQSVLRRHVRNLMARDVDVRRGKADGVHQMRVAARRMRSALKTFRPALDPAWADALRSELSWVADGLGVARDAEVLLARLLNAVDALPPHLVVAGARAKLETSLGADLARGTAEAEALLRSERYVALVDRLVDAAWDPMTSAAAEAPIADAMPPLVLDSWRRLAKRAARVARLDAPDEDWHAARIAAKQVRYTLEAVVPFYGRPAKRLARQTQRVQELLGDHQDAVVASEVLHRLATGPRNGAIGFTLGLVHAAQQDEIRRTRAAFPGVWAEGSDPKLRGWLTS